MIPGGENLTNYPNLAFLKSKSAEGLKKQLSQIYLPHKIISMYFADGYHYAWVSTTNPIKKTLKKKVR